MYQRDKVQEVISASRIAISDSVAARLALGWTYCKTARLTNHPTRRTDLVTLACNTLTMAEEYVAVTPSELLSDVLDDAERLRLELRQLNAKETQDYGEKYSSRE